MPRKPVTTAAFLAGVTTLSVTLPALAEVRHFEEAAPDYVEMVDLTAPVLDDEAEATDAD